MFFILYLVFKIVLIIYETFSDAFKQTIDFSYKIELHNHLEGTDKGIKELQKLLSFQSFIKDFGYFVDKNPEEVVLWDEYLSYAQVFGLTKEIMNSGYKELINNSSFQIDNIDNIELEI